jgi:hypothetical protein
VTWVVRIDHGSRVYLRAPFGSPEFEAEYHTAIRGQGAAAARKPGAGSLQWLGNNTENPRRG